MKYTLYIWCADDEGGYAICRFGEFSPNLGYHPESGWRARPSEKVGDFNTLDELTDLFLSYDDYYSTRESAEKDAKWLMEWFMGSCEI